MKQIEHSQLQNKRIFPLWFRFALPIILTGIIVSCSTTENLPEGEVLYTGIDKISYVDQGGKKKLEEENDSMGVIRSIANAAKRVDELLKGQQNQATEANASNKPKSKMTKEERAAYKAQQQIDEKALAAAETEVNAVLEYAPNNSLFGSSYHRTPFPTGLWAYNTYVGKESGFAKWMYKVFASDPVLISTINPDTRIKVATNTLHNYGYFRGSVDYAVLPNKKNNKKARMNYYVKTGPVYRLDSIAYKGFSSFPDSLLQATKSQSYLKKGDAFNVLNLTSEQSRLETLLRERGYYYYKANMATYKADTVMKPFKVQLVMQPTPSIRSLVKRPWYIGRTFVNILEHEGDTITGIRELRHMTINYSGKKNPLHPLVWIRNVAHRPGRLYRQTDEERTNEMLSALGIFNQFNVNYIRRDTTETCDTLDLYISGVLDKPYTSDFEMNVTEKNNDRIGPGLSWSLQRKNAFHGAELVNFKIYGSYEWRTHQESTGNDKFLNSYNIGTQLSFDFPHIVFPGISRRQFRFPTATSFALNADWLNRSGFFNIFSMGVSATYSWHKKRTSKHELIPFSLSYDKLINSTHEFDSIMKQNPALYVSMRDRFVPAMQYTYTYLSSERHRNPLWWQLTVKEAGNLTSALYALSGKDFSEKNKNLFQNPFAQYLKITSELHNTFRIHHDYKIVTRLLGGIVWSYGNSDYAPYSDQFFVGGANSVRAFTIRTVGPGHYSAPRSKYSYMDLTGDIKLEGNVEFRFPMFGGLNGAVFLDAGNVWTLRNDEMRPGGQFKAKDFLKDIALGTGAGLRYDLDFLVLRLDLGVALHNPARNYRNGYYNIGKFKDGLALHFAIGYPF